MRADATKPLRMIPVTVLTGFLGSGKTTLLARLLRSPAFARTAVIINEFGAVGIDHDLVEAAEESFVELDTGCLCCQVRGDIEATLAELIARRHAGTIPQFERIVIETSGLADPAPLLNAVMAETGRGAGILLEGVVTTVDAVNGLATLAREPQSVRQVAVADRLILTKTDLLPAADEALSARLRQLNPRAPLTTAINGEIDQAALVNDETGYYDVGDRLSQSPATPPDHPTPNSSPEGRRAERQSAEPIVPAHAPDISCITLQIERPLPALALTLVLEALADHLGPDLLRLKGIVHIAEYPSQPAVVHGVQHVFHEPRWLGRWPSDDRATRLVLIGRGLSRLWLESLIAAIVAEIEEVAEASSH